MRILLGVGGGIAAYKSAELARALMEAGHTVQVIMTAAAQEFVRPLTFAALTNQKVITGMFSGPVDGDILSSAIEHIRVSQEHDLLVVAPATADLLAKFAHGLADDFLSTVYLAFTGPVFLAPAMNNNMWSHPATHSNLEMLRLRGHHIIGPDSGPLACGTVGAGRMTEPEAIAAFVDARCDMRRDLDKETVLITAGPTQEPLDPVRYITNRSSGKMGYALAAAARARGARVILVSGPVALPEPAGVELIPVRTANEMFSAVMDHLEPATIIVKSAAVADFHVADIPRQKLKKTAARFSIEFDPTVDILAEVGRRKGNRLLVGFAAETENLVEYARRKLETKNCDLVVGNLVGGRATGTGFEADDNEVVLVSRDGGITHLPFAPKRELADRIFDHILLLRPALHQAG